MALTKKQISEIVKSGVRAVLPKAQISRVQVNNDPFSLDEEPSFMILVIFSKHPKLAGEDLFALDDAIEKLLRDAGESRRPLLRYIDEKEFRAAAT